MAGNPKSNGSNGALGDALSDASWLISLAMSLGDQGKNKPSMLVWRDAGAAEEIAACLLEAAGRDKEAGVHRASAATCYEKGHIFERAVTLLRAALSTSIPVAFKARLRQQLKRCLRKAKTEASKFAQQRRKAWTRVST